MAMRDMGEQTKTYPSNSYKDRRKNDVEKKEKNVKPVVTGKVMQKKASIADRLLSMFFTGNLADTKAYLINDVLIPQAKKLFLDMLSLGGQMLVNGTATKRGDRTDYRGAYTTGRPGSSKPAVSVKSPGSIPAITLENKQDVDNIINGLQDLIEDYGVASIADMHDLVGMESDFTDHKYGWTNISGIRTIATTEGYVMEFPKVSLISSVD